MITYKEVEAETKDSEKKGKTIYILDSKELLVEQLAISVYEKEGYKALWAENDYWSMIVALLFWDVIFARVKGAVATSVDGEVVYLDTDDRTFSLLFPKTMEMNGMPADLFSGEFYENRKNILNNRFSELKNIDILNFIEKSYKNNRGKNCRLIQRWDKFNIDELSIVLENVERDKVLGIFERMLRNMSKNRSGMPDLIVYREKDLFFSEVKGGKDKLSSNQMNWHEYLSEKMGFKVEMFLVNQSEEIAIENIKKLELESSKVKISVGRTSSKKIDAAITYLKEQVTYFEDAKADDKRYGAVFDVKDILELWKILDLTSGWKSQIIEVDKKVIKSAELRNSLYCFKRKAEIAATSEYCTTFEVTGKKCAKKFGCRNIYINQFESDRWDKFGYVDTANGKWIFNEKELGKMANEEIEKLKYCPLFEPNKILKEIEKLPDVIDPKVETKWAFTTENYEDWFWNGEEWKQASAWEEKKFPGYVLMTGIQKISSKDKKDLQYMVRDMTGYGQEKAIKTRSTENIFIKIIKILGVIIFGVFILLFKILSATAKKRR